MCLTLGDCPRQSCVSQAVMWMAWKGLIEERSLHSSFDQGFRLPTVLPSLLKALRPLCFSYPWPAVFCTFQVPAHLQRGRNPFPLNSSHVDCCYLLFWLPGVSASKRGLNLSLSSSCSIKQRAVGETRRLSNVTAEGVCTYGWS